MSDLNVNGANLVKEVELANKYNNRTKITSSKSHKTTSSLAFAYEKARNAVEYRDEHLIRQAAIERILKRRLFLNQSSDKIASLLIKELTWARYIEPQSVSTIQKDKFKDIIEKYRSYESLVGICACEIDEIINFNPINQVIINFTSTTLENLIEIDEPDKVTKSIQIYIATERSFSKSSEVLIKYKLLKVLLPKWTDQSKLIQILSKIDDHLNYKYKDLLRRKVSQTTPVFNIIRDVVLENSADITDVITNQEKLVEKIKSTLEQKYKETKDKVLRASKRSIVYIFLTKMVLAILIEIPVDVLFGNINYFVLSINILFPPSLMMLLNSRIKLPESNNTLLMTEKAIEYLYSNPEQIRKEEIVINTEKGTLDKVFSYIFISTSLLVVLGIIALLSFLSFNFVSQIIFLFFLSVVSFFAFRVREISNDYLLSESGNDSFFETFTDYIFLPIIKSGQWLSSQISKINVLSFIFDFIIEAPLKTFLEILEQWLHFVRVKKEEFLG